MDKYQRLYWETIAVCILIGVAIILAVPHIGSTPAGLIGSAVWIAWFLARAVIAKPGR